MIFAGSYHKAVQSSAAEFHQSIAGRRTHVAGQSPRRSLSCGMSEFINKKGIGHEIEASLKQAVPHGSSGRWRKPLPPGAAR